MMRDHIAARQSSGFRDGDYASPARECSDAPSSLDDGIGSPTAVAGKLVARHTSAKVNVVGIHVGHNSSAAIVRDGVLVSGIQEERLSRAKNQGDFPSRSLQKL